MEETGAPVVVDGQPVIGLLGPTVLFGPTGAVIPIASGRQRTILTLMAARANAPVSTDELIEALWPDEVPRTARNTLQVHLSALRKALAPLARSVVCTVPGGYQLDAGPHDTDLQLAESLVRRAGTAREAGRHHEVVDLLERTIGLRRGVVLADAPLGLEGEQARWESLLLSAEDDRSAALMVSGREGEAIALLERGVRDQPLREHRAGLLALALHRTGRQAEALAVCQRTRVMLREELGCEPGPGLVAVEQVVLGHGDGELGSTVRPQGTAGLVGREEDATRVRGVLADRGWATLTGPAGVGKSRLARVAGEAGDVVAIVDLADLGPVTDLGRAVLSVLGVGDHPALDVGAAVRAWLRDGRLLVLDNVDRSIAPVVELLTVLGAVPEPSFAGRVLVTCRRPLGLAVEPVVEIGPLAVPAADGGAASLQGSAAGRLLLAVWRPPTDDPEEQAALQEIAQLTGGLPLALALAGARLRALGPIELARQLRRSVEVLDAPDRDGDDRHRTLASALDWSIDQLDPRDRRAASVLSVFAAPFTLDAASGVLAGWWGSEGAAAASVARLVEHGLLVRSEGTPARFGMLPPIRSVLRSRLGAEDEARATRLHLEVVAAGATAAARRLGGPASGPARDELRTSLPDLRLALERLVDEQRPEELHRLLARLTFFWFTSGALTEGRGWYRRARRVGGGRPEDRVRSDLAASMLAWWQGDYRDARRRLLSAEGVIEDLKASGHPIDVGPVDYVRASLAWIDGDLERADEAIGRALDRARTDAPGELILASAIGGSISWHRADHPEAVARYQECARVAGQQGNAWARDFARRHEVLMLALAGDHEQCRAVVEALGTGGSPTDRMSRGQALVLVGAASLAMGDDVSAASLVEGFDLAAAVLDLPTLLMAAAALARVSIDVGHLDWVATLLGWAEGVTGLTGLPLAPAEREHLAAAAAAVDAAPDRSALAGLRQRGSELTPAELAGLLLGWPASPARQMSLSPK